MSFSPPIVNINKKNVILCILLCAIITTSFSRPGIILISPYGARQNAMGEVGTALADDESVLYLNPAGLGKDLTRWHGGAYSLFFEPIAPAFDYPDFWHFSNSILYKPHQRDIGGIGLNFNYLRYPEVLYYDMYGASYREGVFDYSIGISYGKQVFKKFKKLKNKQYIGASYKLFKSRTTIGSDTYDGKAYTGNVTIKLPFAIDFGYLLSCHHGLQFGFTLMNMGPPVYYLYKERCEPIPFTANIALGYKKKFKKNKFYISDFNTEMRISRVFIKDYGNKLPDSFLKAMFSTAWDDKTNKENLEEFSGNFGYEIVYRNTVAWRQGIVLLETNPYYDMAYAPRREVHIGLGIYLFNHFRIDWSNIYGPKYSMARDGQWSFSLSFYNIAFWKKDDKYWWKMEEKKPKETPKKIIEPVDTGDKIDQEENEGMIDKDNKIIQEENGEIVQEESEEITDKENEIVQEEKEEEIDDDEEEVSEEEDEPVEQH